MAPQLTTNPEGGQTAGSRVWNALLFIPFIALLWVPFYNSLEPAVWGVPFFYWYQFLWVILTSALIVLVEAKTREPRAPDPASERFDPRRQP